MLDDPALMASVLPLSMSYQPRYLRWSVCSQEFCFNPKLPSIVNIYSGLGKVLPIWRGGGINQKLLLNFARRAAAGEWVHIFPEGGIWQRPSLGGRENGREDEIGRLKWGVGKLIAHSPVRPVVIPFFHWGMETILPQHPVTKSLLTKGVPIPGHRVTVRFGKELHFDDLIEAHEKRFGRLRKYQSSVDRDADPDDFHAHWDSRPEDLALYSAITRRVEEALNELNRESNAELGLGS
jgi:monolysocardiolipin acyltransferase